LRCAQGAQGVLLVGDQQQLPPTVTTPLQRASA
jgi:superfamily I DNA and/or RNA helicase